MLIIAPCVSGCRMVERVKVVTQMQTDTMFVERRWVDTLIVTTPDSATLEALWECDSVGNVLLSKLATQQGRQVDIETQVRYVYVQDTAGKVRRKAYFSAMATVDSLQHRIKILEEQGWRSRRSQQVASKSTTRKGWDAPTIIWLVILIVALYISIRHDRRNNNTNNT